MMITFRAKYLLAGCLILAVLTGCGTQVAQAPEATDTPLPPTATSIPPTATATPVPTDTSLPPTDTPLPPTETPIPPAPTAESTQTPIPFPRTRFAHGMAYDAESDLVIVFGGAIAERALANDTWSYDPGGGQWAQMGSSPSLGVHTVSAMVYDAESDRIIWHGGMRQPPMRDSFRGAVDTWAYDVNSDTWTEQAPGPRGGLYRQLAYDAESDRVILFGGVMPAVPVLNLIMSVQYGEKLDGTWAYDFNSDTWTEMEPSESPPARCSFPMAYDVESDRVILYGGVFEAGAEKDRHVWAYDYNSNTWEQLGAVEGIPLAEGRMAYDVESDRIVLYGGGAISRGGSGTWAYDYNTDTWTKMTPEREPGKLVWHAMTYVDSLDRILLFGGLLGGDFNAKLAEPWVYDYNSDTWEPWAENP